jgi:hypothetical protein
VVRQASCGCAQTQRQSFGGRYSCVSLIPVPLTVGELDLDRPVVEQPSGSFGLDLIAFLAPDTVEFDRVARVFDFEAGLQGAEGDSPPCAVIVSVAGGPDRDELDPKDWT